MRPPKIRSALTRWAVLTRSGSSSTGDPTQQDLHDEQGEQDRAHPPDGRPGRPSDRHRDGGHQHGGGHHGTEPMAILDQHVGAKRGINRPWHSGQSGQARPDPVALTTLPSVMRRNTVATVGHAST